MKNNILRLTENGLILIEDKEAQEVGSIITVEIRLPKDTLIDKLSLKGEVIKSEIIDSNNGKRRLHEVVFVDLTDTDSQILNAYILFLERERKLDNLFRDMDFKGIVKSVRECKEEIIERLALVEFSQAKEKDVPFH